jgi:hypothetical protein
VLNRIEKCLYDCVGHRRVGLGGATALSKQRRFVEQRLSGTSASIVSTSSKM